MIVTKIITHDRILTSTTK